jgi:hypothetical protein
LHEPHQPIDMTATIRSRQVVHGLIHEYRRSGLWPQKTPARPCGDAQVMAGTALLAAAGAAVVVVLRRRAADGTRGASGKRPTRAPVRRRHRTVSRVPAPTAAVRRRASADRPRRLGERRWA